MAQLVSSSSQTSLAFKVTKQKPELIGPSKPTPYELKELSDIDDQHGLRVLEPGIQSYRSGASSELGPDPRKVIKDALGKALVAYYPLAGRLREKENGKLIVECNGQGIMFVEADADVTLDDFGEPLIPPFPWGVDLAKELKVFVHGKFWQLTNLPLDSCAAKFSMYAWKRALPLIQIRLPLSLQQKQVGQNQDGLKATCTEIGEKGE